MLRCSAFCRNRSTYFFGKTRQYARPVLVIVSGLGGYNGLLLIVALPCTRDPCVHNCGTIFYVTRRLPSEFYDRRSRSLALRACGFAGMRPRILLVIFLRLSLLFLSHTGANPSAEESIQLRRPPSPGQLRHALTLVAGVGKRAGRVSSQPIAAYPCHK